MTTPNNKQEGCSNREDVEILHLGPVTVERRGRFVTISSHWDEQNHKAFLDEIAKKRPDLKSKIGGEIRELRNLLTKHDSLEILSPVATYNLVGGEDMDAEGNMKGQPLVELALSLALSAPYPEQPKKPDVATAPLVINSARSIIMETMTYFACELAEKKRPKIEETLRFESILTHLLVRGKTYQHHYLDTVRELFEPVDSFFNKHWRCSVQDFISLVKETLTQISSNVNRERDTFRAALEPLHQLFKDFSDRHRPDEFKNLDDIRKRFNALPEVQKQTAEFHKIVERLGGKQVYEITPNKRALPQLLELLSCSYGDNDGDPFMLKGWEAWPQNESIIFRKPIVKVESKYYCFIPYLLVQNLQLILEDLIKETDTHWFSKRYLNARKQYLEIKCRAYIENMLPSARAFSNLYYTVVENGEEKKPELDGMIIYDENLLLIEAKSAPLHISARRGSVDRIKRQVKEIIAGAYSQCKRAKDYIEREPTPEFYDKHNRLVLKLSDKSRFRNIFLVNVTLDLLGSLAIHLNSVKSLGLLDGREWPWSVYVNDLRAISELVEFPSQLLHYLHRRIRINDFPQFHSVDELDLFGFYLKQGLYFEKGELEQFSKVGIHDFSADIDDYYEGIQRGLKPAKPRQDIPLVFRSVINKIQKSQTPGFTRFAVKLLDLCGKNRQEFATEYERIVKATLEDRKSHQFTVAFDKPPSRLSIVSSYGSRKGFRSETTKRFLSRMKHEKLESWFCLLLSIDRGGVSLDFLIL
jgi:hypothetical protein